MFPPEPRPSRWELHWRMFGGEVRIRPLFWTSCLLLGVPYYQYPKIGGLGAFCLWIAVVLMSLLVHETSHLLAARFFGARPRTVLSGLGGQMYGLEELRRWQRMLVLMAGSLGNLLIFAILWGITALPLPMDWRVSLAPTIWLLMWVNALWSLLNVLPLWPMDGGRLAVEAGEALLGRRGQTLALLLSLLVCLFMTGAVVWWARLNLTNPFDERYLVYLIFFGIMTLYCYAFWLSAFRALWGDSPPLDETTTSDRAA